MRIVFLGTPDFAVASLRALVENQFDVVAVVTAPDKPAGRGMKVQESAVKKYAVEKNIPVLQPIKLKSPDFLEVLQSYKADVQVVVAFRMLPEVVWNMPPLGTINVHASLLPDYRGAAPINWAIINGEHETGVTTFKLKHEIDTGNILLQQKVSIDENDNAGVLHDKLMRAGATLLVETLNKLKNGTLTEQIQIATPTNKHAPKLFTASCEIDWSKTAKEITQLIRGLSPYPGAFTQLNGKLFKIFEATILEQNPDIPSGQYRSDGKDYIHFACADAFLMVQVIQLEGKKRMEVKEFLRGFKLN